MKSLNHILILNQISNSGITELGVKKASLEDISNQLNANEISIPDGFATTADISRLSRPSNNLYKKFNKLLLLLATKLYSNLTFIEAKVKRLILSEKLSQEITEPIIKPFKKLSFECGVVYLDVAIQNSAAAKELFVPVKS